MKSLLTSILLVLLSLQIFSQETEDRILPLFDKLKVSDGVMVYLSRGTNETVKIVASGVKLSEVITEVKKKELSVRLKHTKGKDSKVEVYITISNLGEISSTQGAAIHTQDTLTGDSIKLLAGSKGEIRAEVKFKKLDLKVNPGGNMRIKGSAGKVDASVSVGGTLAALDLRSDSTLVTVGSGGLAKVNAIMLLQADVKMGGSLTYRGSPKIKNIKAGKQTTVNEQEE